MSSPITKAYIGGSAVRGKDGVLQFDLMPYLNGYVVSSGLRLLVFLATLGGGMGGRGGGGGGGGGILSSLLLWWTYVL